MVSWTVVYGTLMSERFQFKKFAACSRHQHKVRRVVYEIQSTTVHGFILHNIFYSVLLRLLCLLMCCLISRAAFASCRGYSIIYSTQEPAASAASLYALLKGSFRTSCGNRFLRWNHGKLIAIATRRTSHIVAVYLHCLYPGSETTGRPRRWCY
jgi:hypothetical protein